MKTLIRSTLIFSVLIVAANCQIVMPPFNGSGGGGASWIPCVGTPGNTVGPAGSICVVPVTGATYSCTATSPAACAVAGDWVAAGTCYLSGDANGPCGTNVVNFHGVSVLPPTTSAQTSRVYVWTQATVRNQCPAAGAGGSGGSQTAMCITFDGATWQAIPIGSTNGTTTVAVNASTATALAATPAQCLSNQYATGVTAAGVANCASVTYSQVGGTPTLPSFDRPAWYMCFGPGCSGDTATNAYFIQSPAGVTFDECGFYLAAAPTGASVIYDIQTVAGVSIFGATKLVYHTTDTAPQFQATFANSPQTAAKGAAFKFVLVQADSNGVAQFGSISCRVH